jgi:integrase
MTPPRAPRPVPVKVRGPSGDRPPAGSIEAWSGARIVAIRAELPERWRVFCDIGEGCGLRQGEILGLDVDLIDMLPHVLHVRQQVRIVEGKLVPAPPKHGSVRDVPMGEPIVQAIAAHMAEFPPTEVMLPWRVPGGKLRRARLLLGTSTGRAVRRDNFNTIWRDALHACGIRNSSETGTQRLRHRYASLMLAGGADIRELAEYLGHSDPAITLRIYVHLLRSSPDRARKAIEKMLDAERDAAEQQHLPHAGDGPADS